MIIRDSAQGIWVDSLDLSEGKVLDFWVKRGAQRLLKLVSVSDYQWLSDLDLDSEEESVEEQEFYSLPDWLRDAAKDCDPMFPWLPLSPDELSENVMPMNANECNEDDLAIDVDGGSKQEEQVDQVMMEFDLDESELDVPLDTEVEKPAKSVKSRLLNAESALQAVELAKEMHKLCIENRKHSLLVLSFIEPWCVTDEIAAVLMSHLLNGGEDDDGDELGWPTRPLCSIALPKFLVLNEPSSRVLLSATIEYCKAHHRAAAYALLIPLILRKEGISNPICDVITRIVKECLHPAHVSSFCQKLLCKDKNAPRFVCLPQHRCLIGDELVWTESLFSLLQNMLNHNVHLVQDSVDQLVNRVCEFSERYSKSLKFGNFVLCLVNKCGPLLKPHRILLSGAIEKTETLVTKSIVSKLSSM